MIETKVVYIPPRYHERMIHAYHCFGWRLQSSIIISDSYYLLPDYDSKRQFRNFYRCEFVREIDEENQAVLTSLEAEFETIKIDLKTRSVASNIVGVSIFGFFVSLFTFILLTLVLERVEPESYTALFVFLFFLTPGLVYNIIRLSIKKCKNNEAIRENIRRFNRRDYILREAYRIASRSNKTNGLK